MKNLGKNSGFAKVQAIKLADEKRELTLWTQISYFPIIDLLSVQNWISHDLQIAAAWSSYEDSTGWERDLDFCRSLVSLKIFTRLSFIKFSICNNFVSRQVTWELLQKFCQWEMMLDSQFSTGLPISSMVIPFCQ